MPQTPTPTPAPALPSIRPRGVHYAAHLDGGMPILEAIDSRGECIRSERIEPGGDPDVTRVWLDGLLEHYDPPRLRLLF